MSDYSNWDDEALKAQARWFRDERGRLSQRIGDKSSDLSSLQLQDAKLRSKISLIEAELERRKPKPVSDVRARISTANMIRHVVDNASTSWYEGDLTATRVEHDVVGPLGGRSSRVHMQYEDENGFVHRMVANVYQLEDDQTERPPPPFVYDNEY